MRHSDCSYLVFHENITNIHIDFADQQHLDMDPPLFLSPKHLEVSLYKQVRVLVSELNGQSNMSLCESGISFSKGSVLIVSLTVIQVLHFSRTYRFGIVYFLR